jgi:hypothetical protein
MANDEVQPASERAEVIRDITNRKPAERELLQQSAELRARNGELTRFNRVAVGRELSMIDLKREVDDLCTSSANRPGTGLWKPGRPRRPF